MKPNNLVLLTIWQNITAASELEAAVFVVSITLLEQPLLPTLLLEALQNIQKIFWQKSL